MIEDVVRTRTADMSAAVMLDLQRWRNLVSAWNDIQTNEYEDVRVRLSAA